MPEQQSAHGQPITTANFEQPFQTEIYAFGQGGLNLRDQVDAVPVGQFPIHTNLTHTMDRGVTVRPGLTVLATAGTNHHSVRRLSDPQNSTYTRIWGIDQSLYLGQSGALAVIDAGYSGDPLYLLPHRPPLSGDPWMFVADRLRMRKVRVDGLDLPIGLPAPATAPSSVLGTRNLTTIADFEGDTDPSLWTANKGYTYDDPPVQTDQPEILDITCPDADNTNAIHFGRIASSVRPTGDYVFFGVGVTRDLSLVGGLPASDDDYIHLWLNFSHPLLIEEFRIYLVCAASFSPTVLPGIPDGLGSNTDAYVKTFSQNDFAAFFAAQADQISAAEAARVHAVRDESLNTQAGNAGWQRGSAAYNAAREAAAARQDPARALTVPTAAGADQWHEMGVLGVPVRRGDFQRMGETAGRDWSTITGIVCFIKTGPNSGPGPVAVRLGNFYLHGGAAPDTGEPGLQPYDYRSTDYDPRTGAESNPGPEMATTAFLDTLRRSIVVTPPAAGDGSLRQRIYRRGGSNNEDWNFLGVNTSNGGAFTDTTSDDDAGAADTLNLDHFEPVPTVDDTGATVLAQPVPVLFGPAQGMIFGLGDPYRPGHLYWCTPGQPDHWGADNHLEVCSPSEELMAGLMVGAQPFCFSRERLYAIYPALTGTVDVSVTTTGCRRGLVSRQAWAIGLGLIFGVAKDCLFATNGGAEDVVSDPISRLFDGQTWNGYAPIDFAFPLAIRLSVAWNDLYFQYQDTNGDRQILVYSLIYKFWTAYAFAQDLSYVLPDDDTPIANILAGGKTTGTSYLHDGFSDAGIAIPFTIRTADWDLSRPREDKLLGDQILDADLQGVTVTLQNRLNSSTIVNAAQAIDVGSGRKRYIFDSFGTTPQRARTISTELVGSSGSARPTFYFLGQSFLLEPDQTLNRVTQWDDLGHPDEKYVMGVTFDVDTGNVARTILIEKDLNGLTSLITTLTVQSDGRHKFQFSWAGTQAHKVRVRPNDDCKAWILYSADWIKQNEPPRIATWDIFFEAAGDQYYTGLDLFCDTSNQEKQIQVQVDGVTLINPYTLEAFWRITANGRSWKHLTFLAGRGHVFHFTAIDANPGLLYSHKWYLDPEPTELSNFDQNFSAWGTTADKYLKAIIFEVDTFGVNKSVRVEVDGTLADTLTINTSGRLVQQISLTTQKLGRIWRIYPADGNPGRLYSAVPIFDVEPYALSHWSTQQTDHDLTGFQVPIDAQITLKSTADVILTLSTYVNQKGTIVTDVYSIPSTGGVKDKRYVPFAARKGVLFLYDFVSTAAFYLYQEESSVQIQPWGSEQLIVVRPFGNDDADRTRNMITPTLAAARSGGGS